MAKELSEARKRANQKWDSVNLKRLSLAMLIPDYNAMREHIAKNNEPQNRFINRAIKALIAAENDMHE